MVTRVASPVRHPDPGFWAGKRVLLTGQTGFKGAWAARMLATLGARVTGFARAVQPGPSAWASLRVSDGLSREMTGDLCDTASLRDVVQGQDIVLHLAAQAIVSEGLRDPAGTWASNLTGTLNLLQALRGTPVQAAVIVTSDKVYANPANGAVRPFVEGDPLGGDDPYSASKAGCEIAVASHRASFADLPPLATARAGNVIGGGDFGRDRLIPDLVRAMQAGQPLMLRNPAATRPFQHVLDVVAAYLILAEDLAAGTAPPAVNFGPAGAELSVSALLDLWQEASPDMPKRQLSDQPPMPEKPRLALNSQLAETQLGWRARLDAGQAIQQTASWYAAWAKGHDMRDASDASLHDYLAGPIA
ncbi:CDP-glucose 4,6-dehydratase [Gemmobacter serpentinus]|uniref:CDP-glucose 4,6-dehydratase n=1 Tax=Gemmobacter serpentinus TaxID=2652247 RepID=UPI001CF71305|nr:CDP-glucose 4,6-dehydratase [Gemmobacter serpentinus]